MRLGMRTGRRWPTDASRSTTLCVRRSKLLGRSRRIAACHLCPARAEDGGEANPSMSPAVSLRQPAPPLLPGFASPPSSAGNDGALRSAANSRAAATLRCVLLREAPTSIRPWVGHRLRRLCSAEERKARGPRAQRASCSDSLRLSERSERSSRSEFRNGATRLSTTGDRRLQGDGAASEAADGGPPAAHARTRTQLTATGSYAPRADIRFFYS